MKLLSTFAEHSYGLEGSNTKKTCLLNAKKIYYAYSKFPKLIVQSLQFKLALLKILKFKKVFM